jgi:hypothetical protein
MICHGSMILDVRPTQDYILGYVCPLLKWTTHSGHPIGYWAFDPDGHRLELYYGQEIGLTVEKTP